MSIRLLSEDLQIKSQNELNENSERLKDDLKHILNWLNQQPHLNVRKDEQWLLTFLRGCKFSLQKTKEKLDAYYTVRTKIPEFFSNRDPMLPEIQEVLKLGLFLPLTGIARSDAPRVIVFRCEPADPLKVPYITLLKTITMIVDILMNEDDNFIIAGHQAVYDIKGLQVNHVVQITPSVCKKSVVCIEQAYPVRIKNVYFINAPSIFESVFNVLKSFLTEKIKNRVYVSSENNLDEIYKIIPRSILPKEYGGDGETLDELTVYWKKKVESYRKWFLEEAEYCSNESLRLGKPSSTVLFGVEGSFRELNID